MSGPWPLAPHESRPGVIAALYVETGGAYYGLEGVDPWDEDRDARSYEGPHPVVAHPPCSRWCQLASVNQARWGAMVGDDGGTAFQRGILIHRLLQMLPDLAPDLRRDTARSYLSRPLHNLRAGEVEVLLEETFGVLENPQWAPIFAPGGRS